MRQEKTLIFEHKGFVGILGGTKMVAAPGNGNIGCVVKVEDVKISPKALAIMKSLQKERGSFAEIMCFESQDGPMLGWMGGIATVIDKDSHGDRDYKPQLLDAVVDETLEAPQDFKDAMEESEAEGDEN